MPKTTREERIKRNDEIAYLYMNTDATLKELGERFNLSPGTIWCILHDMKAIKKQGQLLKFAQTQPQPLAAQDEKNSRKVWPGNYSNRAPHPRINHDYNLVPINSCFGARYVEVNEI